MYSKNSLKKCIEIYITNFFQQNVKISVENYGKVEEIIQQLDEQLLNQSSECVKTIEKCFLIINARNKTNNSDNDLIKEINNKMTSYQSFKKSLQFDESFTIKHFSCQVEYQIESFCKKNLDKLNEEHFDRLKTSSIVYFIIFSVYFVKLNYIDLLTID